MLKFNQNMKYFFVLGSNPTLSLAELAAIFNYGKLSLVQKNIAILESGREIKSDALKKIGGVIKFGLIYNELNSPAVQGILKAMVIFSKPEKLETKFNFGVSFYGQAKINIKALAMEFKKLLKQTDINSRWVISREPVLSSVVVEQNKLTSGQGVEIVIIEFNKKIFLGKTIAVQPFKELSFRDYGRPARDDRSGMLPPKLAQIMINLALPEGSASSLEAEPLILDSFCGSGTILTEAMLMGCRNIVGADISTKAILDTKTNIVWLQKNYELPPINYKLLEADATQIAKYLAPNSIDAIITEPYLGPPRGRIEVNKIKFELEKLYSESLREFYKILKPSGRIVIVWPVFQVKHQSNFINPNLNGFTIINPIPENLRKNIFLKLTKRNTIVYGREEQRVWREIVALEKQ